MVENTSQNSSAGIAREDLVQLYTEVYSNIRETDQISFRLLGFVPLVSGSGAGLLALLIENNILKPLPIILISLLGAIVTFSLYRWELRNIQTCSRLLKRAKFLETMIGFGELAGRDSAPPLWGHPIGKTQAETVIYIASMVAWLVPILAIL